MSSRSRARSGSTTSSARRSPGRRIGGSPASSTATISAATRSWRPCSAPWRPPSPRREAPWLSPTRTTTPICRSCAGPIRRWRSIRRGASPPSPPSKASPSRTGAGRDRVHRREIPGGTRPPRPAALRGAVPRHMRQPGVARRRAAEQLVVASAGLRQRGRRRHRPRFRRGLDRRHSGARRSARGGLRRHAAARRRAERDRRAGGPHHLALSAELPAAGAAVGAAALSARRGALDRRHLRRLCRRARAHRAVSPGLARGVDLPGDRAMPDQRPERRLLRAADRRRAPEPREPPDAVRPLLGLLAYKPQMAAAAFVALVCGRYWRVLGVAAVVGLVLAAASWTVFGTEPWLAFLGSLGEARAFLESGRVPWDRMATVFATARIAGLDIGAAYALQIAVALAALAVLAQLWWRRTPLALSGSVLVLSIPLTTPYAYDYDLVMLLLPLVWIAQEARATRWQRGEAVLLLAAWVVPVAGKFVAEATRFQPTSLVLLLLLLAAWRRTSSAEAAVELSAPSARS